jgi:hypothetical protein
MENEEWKMEAVVLKMNGKQCVMRQIIQITMILDACCESLTKLKMT